MQRIVDTLAHVMMRVDPGNISFRAATGGSKLSNRLGRLQIHNLDLRGPQQHPGA